MKRAKISVAMAVKTALLGVPGAYIAVAGAAEPQPQLEEVLVYGKAETYRPENQTTATGLDLPLIDTPQSVSIISDEMLKRFDAQSIYDVAAIAAGVSQAGLAFGNENLLVRGQVPADRVNGIILPGGAGLQYLDSFALDRVEIVRGPATVLYGITGAFGGEVNQILKKPQADYHADLEVEGGDFALKRYAADLTGAVPGTDDRLKLRFLGSYQTSGIPQETIDPDRNIAKMGMAAATFDFTDATSLYGFVYRSDKHVDPFDGCPLAQTTSGELYIPTSISTENYYCNDPKHTSERIIDMMESGTLTHRFGDDWTLKASSIGAEHILDIDYVYRFGPAGVSGLPSQDVFLYSYQEHVASNLSSANVTLGGKFDLFSRTHQFFAALQYQNLHESQYNYQSFGLGTMNMFQDGGKGILAGGGPIPEPPTAPLIASKYYRTKEVLGSVQALINPFDRFDILAGVLVQRLNQDANDQPTGGTFSHASVGETDVIKRLALTYGLIAGGGRVLTEAKAYASYSEGVVPNVGYFSATGEPLTDPQHMRSYELGLKSKWVDGHVDANLALYHSNVTNQPSGYFAQGSNQFVYTLTGTSKFDGAEVEMLGEVTPGWNVALSYSHIKAIQSSQLLGTDLVVANVPRDQASLFTSYEFLAGPAKGLILGTSVVRSSHYALVSNDGFIHAGGYDPNNQVFWGATTVGFNATYKDFAGAVKGLEIYADIHNAFSARYYNSSDVYGDGAFGVSLSPPRAITAGIRYRF